MRQVRGTVNTVELIGWLGDVPEQRIFPSGARVCRFNVATKHFGARSENGEREIETDWTLIEAWDKLGDQCINSLHKGSRVRIVGSLRTQSWEDKETGLRRYKAFVRAEEVLFLDSKANANENEQDAIETSDEAEEVPF
ncbi:MAG: single-stranded DNA-binding protein [Roseiflexus castenholzii]|jgi:single-strand DNA-binding protein|uniref:Single-stranded DNA-binding protein n=1 Tax=Roseiflexus castenholzii (strain DSM 13941 / HLO8) TaxID=383372 RepID=A7NKW6_ROSCS|nr:single-stranded DNA-binding protein [Roseiflexus castenholzii]ABU58136.1 single-strand binding protein [Roseiflexus castenholzii DSM 13941]PMP84782.1 MAG: single-stranded DNA-binding protein [Roseiflexus castenholzii]